MSRGDSVWILLGWGCNDEEVAEVAEVAAFGGRQSGGRNGWSDFGDECRYIVHAMDICSRV